MHDYPFYQELNNAIDNYHKGLPVGDNVDIKEYEVFIPGQGKGVKKLSTQVEILGYEWECPIFNPEDIDGFHPKEEHAYLIRVRRYKNKIFPGIYRYEHIETIQDNAIDVKYTRLFFTLLSFFPDDYRYLLREIWAEIQELSGFITQKKGINGVWKWPLFIIVFFLLIVVSIIRIILFPVSFLIKTIRHYRIWKVAIWDDLSEPMDNSEDSY